MRNSRITRLVQIALFAALMAVTSQISFPLPFTAIPFTLGIFGAFLTGALLRPGEAVEAQLIYLLLGAAGLPVFSQFMGGIGVLAGPTGGFLAGYVGIALIVSAVRRRWKGNRFMGNLTGMVMGLAVCYLCGMLWFMAVTSGTLQSAFVLCVLPFIPFDLMKAVLAAAFGGLLETALEKSGLYLK